MTAPAPSTLDESTWARRVIERIIDECPRRQPTSDDERRAQELIAEHYEALGLETSWHHFRFNDNLYANLALHAGVALAGMISAWNMPKAPAADPLLRIDYNPISATWNIVRELTRHRTVFLSCLGVSWFWFYGSIYFTQLPYFTKEVLGGGSGVLTLLLTVFSIGTGVGSLLCERMSGHRVEIGLVPFGSIGMTVFGIDLFFATPLVPLGNEITVAAFLQAPGTWRLLFDLFGMAVFGGFFIVPLFAMIQQQSAAAIRSRIIAANNILNAAFMVAAALFSIALTSFAEVSIPQLLLIVAVLNALVAIYIYSLVPEFLLRFLSWLLINALYRVRPKGLDQIPEEGPVLLEIHEMTAEAAPSNGPATAAAPPEGPKYTP